MTDTLFIQFVNQIKDTYFDLGNGFSDAYDLCKSKGDFYWMEHEVDREKWYVEETYADRKLPLSKGVVYISALYLNHLYQSYVWAKEYPNVDFVVGGPVAAERRVDGNGWYPLYLEIEDRNLFPSNLKITGKSVEDWFGVPNFSGKWKLDIPDFIASDSPIYLSYTLDNNCYWRKCVYCNIALHAKELYRKRKDFKFEFKNLTHEGRKIIRLNTGSVTPNHIRNLVPQLPRGDNLEYQAFMRPAKAENEALKEAVRKCNGGFPNLMLGLGIEFPSNRMLHYIGKGIDKSEIIESLQICSSNGIQVNGNFILGWNNLTEADITELEEVMQRIPENSVTKMQIRWLFAHPYTKIHDVSKGVPIKLGPFYVGFHNEIGGEQMKLNKQAENIITHYSSVKHFKVEGLANVRKNER